MCGACGSGRWQVRKGVWAWWARQGGSSYVTGFYTWREAYGYALGRSKAKHDGQGL